MCGINGIYQIVSLSHSDKVIRNMNTVMRHRGPDDDGVFVEGNIALGHKRLSIIDLSNDGHQPLFSNDKRYVIIYNGELYNYQDLKKELQEYSFQSKSDTEVILAAYIKWGAACLDKLNGMFAFSIWDKQAKELFIARDRMGIKPLYYHQSNDNFIFSSEIRSLLASNLIPRKLNKTALQDFCQYQTIHAPNTIIENVKMLLPGHYIIRKHGSFEITQYWRPENKEINIDNSNVKENIKTLLTQSVEKRMIADVPLGAFLSGGIDSSIIVGLMSEISDKAINTFSVNFDEEKFSEAKYSNQIAKKFNTNHHPIKVTASDFLKELPNALNAMDHPSGDGLNSYLVSKVTKEAGITVALSGLGGDELFAGYSIFKQSLEIKSKNFLNYIPHILRTLISEIVRLGGSKVAVEKIAEILALPHITPESIYKIFRRTLSDYQLRNLLLDYNSNGNQVNKILKEGFEKLPLNYPILSKVSIAEITTYMQNTLLRDTDQMSMAHALEIRVPFLDHNLVEYILSIPDDVKYPHTPKKILIDSFTDVLPDNIVNRPKMGFVFPWEYWLKNELCSFCEDKIYKIEARGIFTPGEVTKLWKQFLSGNKLVNWSRVWPFVVLENWMQQNDIEA